MATNTGGRPPFEPTAEQRQNVEIMVSIGIPQVEICRMVRGPNGTPINKRTLEKHFPPGDRHRRSEPPSPCRQFHDHHHHGTDPPPGFKPITDEKVRGNLIDLFAPAQLNWRKTVRNEHANADGKPFVYQANKTDSKL